MRAWNVSEYNNFTEYKNVSEYNNITEYKNVSEYKNSCEYKYWILDHLSNYSVDAFFRIYFNMISYDKRVFKSSF